MDGAVQAPAPLQTVAVVAEAAEQVAVAQVIVPPGKEHAVALLPPQLPAQGAVPPHGVRLLRGVPVTVTQVPTLLDSAHPWHCPAQARLQQTLSTQFVLVHSAPLLHCVPFDFKARQTPVLSQ